MSKKNNLSLRKDLEIIAGMIPDGSSVLDVGCSVGILLEWLAHNKGCKVRGLELCSESAAQAMAKGLSVVQGDIDEDLPYYPDKSYDYLICSKTLQATSYPNKVLQELVRVGRKVIISVPNFGYWQHRLHLGLKGRMPMSRNLSYQWYETPNIHFCTIGDFVELCESLDIKIEKRLAIYKSDKVKPFRNYGKYANIFAEEAVFLLEKLEI